MAPCATPQRWARAVRDFLAFHSFFFLNPKGVFLLLPLDPCKLPEASKYYFSPHLAGYAVSGSAQSVAAGRISYSFGLRGPSISVDTACSTSIVALSVACDNLALGEISRALVAAVNLTLTPEFGSLFLQAGMLALDGRCKSLDASADGYVRSEEASAIYVTVAGAEADAEPDVAIVAGVSVNQARPLPLYPVCKFPYS